MPVALSDVMFGTWTYLSPVSGNFAPPASSLPGIASIFSFIESWQS